MKVLVTGANGFIGRALVAMLESDGVAVVAATRASVGGIDAATDWRAALAGCDAVVHLAARVHVMRDSETDPLALYRAVNVDGTLNLTRQAVAAGVRRLVFVSSIKVNGEGREAPYTEADAPQPQDAYAVSKWEAEQGLQALARETGLEVVVLRPPLVYGAGVGANFGALMRAVGRGWPLPLGALTNRRSLLYRGNLVSALAHCVRHPAAAGQTFLIDDGEAVSTPQLVRELAAAMERPARLVAVPTVVLRGLAAVAGRRAAAARLTGSLVVDAMHLRRTLGWTPPFTRAQGLAETVAALK